jgi:hypothetical protein
MKQIFTLLTALFLTSAFSLKANSQNINEGFNSSTEVTALVNSCWTFNTFNFSTSSPIADAGSMVSQLGSPSEIITPELQIPSTLTVSFSYNTVTSTGGSKTLKILLDINGVETILETINLNPDPSGNFTASYTNANTPGNNIYGSRKLIFRVTANASVKFDALSINAPYTYAGGCSFTNIPLPIKLLNFQAALSKDQAQLNWMVDDNQTGDYFEVERSADGKNFSTVAIVSTTATQGNETYQYKETAQTTAYYRLRIVNKDKSTSYSKILLIKSQTESANTMSLLQNPVQETLTFSFTSATNANNEVAVYNLVGAKVYAEKILAQKGKNSVSVKLNSYLSAGTYILEVRNANERSIAKFIKQ